MSLARWAKSGLKYPLIRLGLEISALPALRMLMPQAAGRGVIWTLHHVRPQGRRDYAPNAVLSVTPEFLEEAVRESLAAGLTPVHLHDLPALLADPAEKRNFVVFTLDDGYRNNRTFAAPVFRRFAIPHTIFTTPGFVERSWSMWWETVEQLTATHDRIRFDFGKGEEWLECATPAAKTAAFGRFVTFIKTAVEADAVARIDAAARAHGIDPIGIVDDLVMTADELGAYAGEEPLVHFGAHTMTHRNLSRLDDGELKHEVEASISGVEALTGTRPRSFSYPYGWGDAFCPRAQAAVSAAGISVAVTTRPGVLRPQAMEHATRLPRVSLNGLYQKPRYVRALLSGIPFRLMG